MFCLNLIFTCSVPISATVTLVLAITVNKLLKAVEMSMFW